MVSFMSALTVSCLFFRSFYVLSKNNTSTQLYTQHGIHFYRSLMALRVYVIRLMFSFLSQDVLMGLTAPAVRICQAHLSIVTDFSAFCSWVFNSAKNRQNNFKQSDSSRKAISSCFTWKIDSDTANKFFTTINSETHDGSLMILTFNFIELGKSDSCVHFSEGC